MPGDGFQLLLLILSMFGPTHGCLKDPASAYKFTGIVCRLTYDAAAVCEYWDPSSFGPKQPHVTSYKLSTFVALFPAIWLKVVCVLAVIQKHQQVCWCFCKADNRFKHRNRLIILTLARLRDGWVVFLKLSPDKLNFLKDMREIKTCIWWLVTSERSFSIKLNL